MKRQTFDVTFTFYPGSTCLAPNLSGKEEVAEFWQWAGKRVRMTLEEVDSE